MSAGFILLVSMMTFSPAASSAFTFARSSTSLNAPRPVPEKKPFTSHMAPLPSMNSAAGFRQRVIGGGGPCELEDTHPAVQPVAIPSAGKVPCVEPRELLAEVRALGLRRGDDLREQHRDKFIEMLKQQVSVLLI